METIEEPKRRLWASLLTSCIILCQAVMIFPVSAAADPAGPLAGLRPPFAKDGGLALPKASLSDAEKKFDTSLLKLLDESYLLPGEDREAITERLEKRGTYGALAGSDKSTEGLIHAYVYMEDDAPIGVIAPFVREIEDADDRSHLAAVFMEKERLLELANLPEVRTVDPVALPAVRRGSATAEADRILASSEIRETLGADGKGIKIGIISDGADSLEEAIASGDLPSDVVVLGNSSGGNEGVAMMEIIHDMAPGASLYFHGGGETMLSFNKAVDNLIEAGCKIIVDDLGYDDEAFFEDGVISKHLSEVMRSREVIFVSSAGNGANAHHQSRYHDDGKGYHDFSGGTSDKKYLYVELAPGEELDAALQWDDPFGRSQNDYDLQFYEAETMLFLTESADTQDGDDNPLEILHYANDTGRTLKIEVNISAYDAGAKNILEIFLYTEGDISLCNVVAQDSIYGHPNTEGVLAVGAISAKDYGQDTIEYYSARGPSTIGGKLRDKPDITALDNIAVSGAGDFKTTFIGTSAAAPAVAAILAQLWSAFPAADDQIIKEALLDSAVDLGPEGFDPIFGHGRADAKKAYASLKARLGEKSAEKEIISFIIAGKPASIDKASRTVRIELDARSELAFLVPVISISKGADISPASKTANDFTRPVTYIVTAEDGSRVAYTVIVSKPPSPDIREGDIIQCKSSANPFAVYIVKIIGQKRYIRHIVSLEIFNHYPHLQWENLIQVSSLESYSLSGWVRVNTGPNGTAGPKDQVWEINGDQTRHWIDMTAQEFLLHGGSEEAIYSINQGELDLYKIGAAVKLI